MFKPTKVQLVVFAVLTAIIALSLPNIDKLLNESGSASMDYVVLGNIFISQLIALFIVIILAYFAKSNFKKWLKVGMVMLGLVLISLFYGMFVDSFRGPATESNGRSDITYICEYGLDYGPYPPLICHLRNIPKNLGDVFRNFGIQEENREPSDQEFLAFLFCQAFLLSSMYLVFKKNLATIKHV